MLGVLFWVYQAVWVNRSVQENKTVELSFWGLGEDEAVMRQVADNYQLIHPKVKITYNKQTVLNYRTRVQTQMRSEGGPDIVEIHSSWVPMFWEDLNPLPSSVISAGDFAQTFYPVAKDTLTWQGNIYAMPLEIDGLAMYYNEDILGGVGVGVPSTWQDFIDAARSVTVRNQQGQIQTAGAALGTTSNIDFWPEILGVLFLQQPEGNLAKPANQRGAEVLQFYTNFITDPKSKTWDVTLPASTQMFIDGRLAFYFGPLRQSQLFQGNPALHFKVAPIPQLPGKNVAWGSFWAAAVSSKSQNPKEAWEFLQYLTSPETQQLIYQMRAQNQTLGRIFPRADMGNLLINDPLIGPFVAQAPFYHSWYLNSQTQDRGINEEIINLYSGAVNGVLQGGDPGGLLQTVQTGVAETLNKYSRSAVATPAGK